MSLLSTVAGLIGTTAGLLIFLAFLYWLGPVAGPAFVVGLWLFAE